MSLKNEVQMLRRVPLFAGIPEARLRQLAFASEVISFSEGQTLVSEADGGESCYVIISGEVDVLEKSANGLVKVGEAGECSVVGEGAILSDRPRQHTVRARTAVEALQISRSHFHTLMACCPKTMGEVVRALSNRAARLI